MTIATEAVDRALVAARLVGEIEAMLRIGLVHPSRQARVASLVRQFNAALDGTPSPEAVAREQGRSTS
jgi:hypothetical protein